MSKNLSKSKKIQTSFTAKQPGYINVAGETFFLSDDDTVFSAKLYDDSVKGDLAFQTLFLAPFNKIEQETLRNIYRTIFGSGSVIGRKGLSLPCEEDEVDLLVKSLIYRRDKLLQQIKSYKILLSNDMHARYMREHLVKLNALIDDEIPNTLAPCKDTDVVSIPGKLSGLTNERMMKLLDIFAFMLAQGRDPLKTLLDADPSALDILPRMAKRGAKKLRDYESEFEKANPGKPPEYTETLKKIRRVLTDTSPEPATDKELVEALAEIESFIGIDKPAGSVADRKAKILEVLKGLREALVKVGNCERNLATITAERDRLSKRVQELEEDIKKMDPDGLKKRIAELEAQIKDLLAQIIVLQEEINTLEADAKVNKETILALQAENERLKKALQELDKIRKELDAAKTKIIEQDKLIKEQEEVIRGHKDLTAELQRLQQEVEELRKRPTLAQLEALQAQVLELSKRPTQESYDSLLAEIEQLRKRANITPEDVERLQSEINRLRPFQDRADITPEELEELRDQIIDPEEIEYYKRTIEGLEERLGRRADISPEDLLDLQRRLAAAEEKAALSQSRIRALEAQVEILKAKIKGLEVRPDITQEDLKALQDELNKAKKRIEELERLIPDIPDNANRIRVLQEMLDAARQRITELEGRADITPADLKRIQDELADSKDQIQALQAEVDRRPDTTKDIFEQYKAAKRRLDELDAVLANITPERLRQLLQTEKECDEIRRRLQSYEEIGMSVEEIRKLKANLDEKDGTIRDLREQLEKANAEIADQRGQLEEAARTIGGLLNYKTVFNDLNRILREKGYEPLPEPTGDNFDEISGRFGSYLQKPAAITETTNLCFLNMLYTIIRKMYAERGTKGITQPLIYQILFQKIDRLSSEPIDGDIADLFFMAMKAWKQNASRIASAPVAVVSADKVDEYKRKFAKLTPAVVGLFTDKERDQASYILREIIPKDNDFRRYILDGDNRIKLSQSRDSQPDTKDMALLFLLFLTYVNKFLKEKRPELEAAGCPILP